MKRTACLCVIAGVLAGLSAAGCNAPPRVPRSADGKAAKELLVDLGNAAELQAARTMEVARVNYAYRLNVLRQYYEHVGNMDKYNWAGQETKNLHQAVTFTWAGAGEIPTPGGESVEGADERVLVESVVLARQRFLQAVQDMLRLYDPSVYKARRLQNVLDRFDPVRTYMYFLSVEIPPADVRATEVIPAAEALYDKAYKLYREGKVLPGVTDYKKERQALVTFLELARNHSRSTRAPLAAYHIGEIYKEYFNEDVRAVHWYSRAWQWDPNITKPARFQAAVVYDLRLQNKAKAVDLYRQVLQHEQFNASNVRYARERIKHLTGEDVEPKPAAGK